MGQQVLRETTNNAEIRDVVLYNGKDLAALGGEPPSIITERIAEALFNPEELAALVIDP